MTWLAAKLNKRVQIGNPIQRANDEGGFDFSFDVILTVWMGMNLVGNKGAFLNYLRGQQINETATHKFIVRKIAVQELGREFSLAFSNAFKYMPDLMPLTSDYFLFLQKSNSIEGRLFRILGAKEVKERNEYLEIDAEEIEERGAGHTS